MPQYFQNVEQPITAGLSSQFPGDRLPELAFSGRSNVGKSSLLNQLAGRKSLARVSGSPGKTITVNFYRADKSFYLVDLPGYGFAKRAPADKARWSRLTDDYFRSGRARAVAQLIDLKVGPTADDEMMLDYLTQTGVPFFVIATKADKLNTTGREKAVAELIAHPLIAGKTVIPFSSLDGRGRDEARREILAMLGL